VTTSFPGGLDAFTNPTSGDTLASPDHAAQHADVNDAVEALQAKVGANSSVVTTSHDYKIAQLEVKSPTITLSGDASGSVTLTNLGSGTLTVTVNDDSHNHVISNVDGLQTALDSKLPSSSYTASDVLTKIKTVDGSGSGLDADTVDGLQASQFLRADASDSTTGTLTIGGQITQNGTGINTFGGESTFTYTSTSNDWSAQPVQLITTNDSGYAARWGSSDSNTAQLRPAAGVWYVRNHNDSAYWTLAAVISNQSSKNEKQDIEPWTPAVPVSAGSMANPSYTTIMGLLNQVEVVQYRWDKQRYCIAKETHPENPDHDDSHVCGVDCDCSPDDPCNYYKNWERGTIGFVAEDLGEVFPQATNIDLKTGENTAIDGLAVTAIVVKALQEIDSRLAVLEGSAQ
jgi:hypothetical protein